MNNPEENDKQAEGISITNIDVGFINAATLRDPEGQQAPSPVKGRFLAVAEAVKQDSPQLSKAVTDIAEFAFNPARQSTALNVVVGGLREEQPLLTPPDTSDDIIIAKNNIIPGEEAKLIIDYMPDSQAIKAGDPTYFESSISIEVPINDYFSVSRIWTVNISIHNGQANLKLSKDKKVEQDDKHYTFAEPVRADELSALIEYLTSDQPKVDN